METTIGEDNKSGVRCEGSSYRTPMPLIKQVCAGKKLVSPLRTRKISITYRERLAWGVEVRQPNLDCAGESVGGLCIAIQTKVRLRHMGQFLLRRFGSMHLHIATVKKAVTNEEFLYEYGLHVFRWMPDFGERITTFALLCMMHAAFGAGKRVWR